MIDDVHLGSEFLENVIHRSLVIIVVVVGVVVIVIGDA